MAKGLSGPAFQRLLERLDADPGGAGERYEDLRRLLVRFFEWRGAPFPEDHADEALDRVARRMEEGVVVASVGPYCYNVAKLILLEVRKAPDSRRAVMDEERLSAPAPGPSASEAELRMDCLDDCLGRLPAEHRTLIVEYYRDGGRDRIQARRALAETLGIRSEALANRAQRLRDKLERCVTGCVRTKAPT